MGKIFGKIKVILASILATILLSSPCFADGGITLTTDKTDLTAGDEITVTADFPDDTKIYALTATFQYDQNVFEPIDDANFALSNTASILYNSSNKKFGIINQTGEVEDNLFSVRLRVKNDSNVGDTNIALTNISSSDGSNTTNYDVASTKVSVTRDVAEGEVVPTNQENTIVETPSEPENVFYSTPFVIAAIVAVAVIALFLVYHRNKINPTTSRLHYTLVALGITIVALIIGLVAINNGKKDVDGNGTVDYGDAEDIIGYLIDIQNEGKEETSDDNTSTTDNTSVSNNSSIQQTSTSSNRPVTSSTTNSANSNSSLAVNSSSGSANSSSSSNSNTSNNSSSSDISSTTPSDAPSDNPPSSNPSTPDQPSIDDPAPSDPSNPSTSDTPSDPDQPSIGDDPSTPDQPSDPPKTPSDYDTDNDGDVDVDDAGHNTEEAQKNTKIELQKLDDTEKYYVEKGNETIQFLAKISPEKVTLKKVKINDRYYDIEPSDIDGELYTIKVDPMFNSGQHDYKITEVQASNGKVDTPNFTLNYEVLKSRPEVIDFHPDLENHQISFKLEDIDHALKKGEVKIYDINDLDNALSTQSFDSSTDPITLQNDALAAERGTFYLEIRGDYCLVNDQNNSNHCYHGDLLFGHQFTMDDHYDFALTDFSLSDYVEPLNHPVMNFKSSNSKDLAVSRVRVTIDGQVAELPASLAGDGTFEVTLPAQTASGERHQVILKEVILADGMVFTNPTDFATAELSYFVPKNLPKVTNFALQDAKDDTNIKATFNLEDLNSTVSELSVILTDVNDNIIAKNTLSREQIAGQTSLTTNLNYTAARDKTFFAKVLVDYDLGDKYNFTQVNLAESDITLPMPGKMYIDQEYITPVAGIVSDSTAKITKYAEKSQKSFGIAFKFVKDPEYKIYGCKNVEYTGVSSYTVNGNNYSAFGLGNGLKNQGYTTGITLGVPDQAGVIDLSLNRVQFVINKYYNQCSDWFAIPKVSTQFEVLRDIPKIANLKIANEDYENQTVTFDFDVIVDPAATDGDESFTGGILKLGDQSATFDQRGHNSVTLNNVPRDATTDLDFQASFDRDTDALNNDGADENQFENYSIYKTEYGLFSPETYQNVKIENAKAYTNYKEQNDNFFEKNEPIGLYFDLAGLPESSSRPVSAIVDDHGNSVYDLVQVVDRDGQDLPDRYAIFANGYPSAGTRTLTITSLILDNGKVINVNNSPAINFEILKDTPTISNLAYQKDGAEIEIASELEDPDGAIVGTPQVSIVDEDGESVYSGNYTPELTANNNGNTHYTIKITGDFSRTSNSDSTSNPCYQSNATLLDRVISLANNKIELKNINDVSLYRTVDGKSELVDEISKTNLNRDAKNYFAKITMNNLSTVYLPVVKAEDGNDNHLYLVLNSADLVLEPGEDQPHLGLDGKIRLDFGELTSGDQYANKYHRDTSAADKSTFEELIKQLNQGGDVTLTQDYDASGVDAPSDGYYVKNFSAKFDGAGHTIKNLKGALFETLTGEAHDFYLENVVVENKGKGSLAHVTKGAKVSRIIVHGATLKNGSDQSGGLIGNVDEKTIVDSCAVTGLNLMPGGVQQIGGLAGAIRNGSTIQNVYVEGQISGPSGYLGGIAGSSNTTDVSTIKNSYSKVTLNNANPACGISCIYTGKINFVNNVSFSTNITYPISNDEAKSDQFENNYYLTPAGKAFANRQGQTVLSGISEINRSLFDKLGFSPEIWRLNNSISSDSLPKFVFDKTSQTTLEKQDNYSEAKINIYDNLQKLAPFYELQDIVKTGNKLTDDTLASKSIQSILPVDVNGNLVSYLTTNDPAKIAKLKIVFSDGSHQVYDVQYDKTYDMVATYRIPALHLDYTFPHYVIDANARIVDNLTYYLKTLDYTGNLDNLTAASEGRILRDFYNNTTVNELKEFVLKYLSSTNYTPTSDNNAINDYLERTVKQDHKIEKALYAYNYFRRLYDVEVDGLKLYDYVLFGLENQNANLSTENLINALFADSTAANSSTLKTSSTNNTYVNILAKHTGQANLPAFLESVVQNFGHGQTMSEWVRSEFEGFLAERSIDGRDDYNSDTGVVKKSSSGSNGTYYTLWDHFSHPHLGNDNSYLVYNFILPILTLPENSTYIISTPVQFIIGNQRTYIQYRSAPGAQEAFNFRVKSYADRMQNYFKTAYGLLQDTNQFNNIHIFQLDKTLAYDAEDNGYQISQRAGSTTDPHFQNFNEVVNIYPADQSVNAASWGPYTEFQVAGVMDATIKEVYDYQIEHGNTGVTWDESTFGTWSHETAHSIDSSIWMRGQGRRWRSGGEDYADGNLRQEFNANLLVMNAVKDWGDDCGYASNCSPERIDTPDEIQDFYSKAFDVIYTIDYLQAQAFLELDNFSKSQIGTQISYPNEAQYINSTNPNEKAAAYGTTKYSWLTEDQWSKLSLNSIDDLYNNKIMVYPGYYKETSRGAGSYGGEGINVAHWYQPHNYFGMPDSYSLKWLAYEMMSVGGYDGGYIKYNSNIGSTSIKYTDQNGKEQTINGYKTDAVINEITNYSDFDSYKKDRFAKIEEKLEHLNSVINVKEYVQELYDAMVLDAREQKDNVQAKFNSKDGGEEACLKDYWCMHGWRQGQEGYSWYGVLDYVSQPHTTAVRHKIYQALKNLTHDFVDNNVIYNDSYHQDVSNLRESIIHRSAEEIKKDHEFSDQDINESGGEQPEDKDDIENP